MNTYTSLKDSIYYLTNGFDNLDARSNYIVQSLAELNTKDNWQRAISIAMPFFSLHSKAAPAVSFLSRGYQFYAIWAEDSKTNYSKPLQTALLAGSIALDHIFPPAQLLYSSLVLFITEAQKLGEGGWRDKGAALYQISSQIVHLASIYYGTPKWAAVSLLSQAAGEAGKAHAHYTDKKTPEAIANVLLAGIRGYKAGCYIYNDFSLARAKPAQPKPVSPEEYGVSDDDYENPELDYLNSEDNNPADPVPEIKSDEPDFSEYDFTEDYDFSDDSEFPELDYLNSEDNNPADPVPEIKSDETDFSEYYFTEDNDFSDDSEFPESDTELSFPNSEAINPPAEKPAVRNLTTSDWKILFQKYFSAPQEDMTAKLHLATLLKIEGFSNTLNDIDFTQTGPLNNIYFDSLKCTNCNFSGMLIFNSEFCKFNAINCNFTETNFTGSYIRDSLFRSCNFTQSSFRSITYSNNTIENCIGSWFPGNNIITAPIVEPELAPAPSSSTVVSSIENQQSAPVEEPDDFDQIKRTFKNPSAPFTDLDHELSGDLGAKIDVRRYTMVETNGQEYDFGSYFHGYGKYLVKGANLHFRKVVFGNGSKGVELSFKINHIYHERLREIIYTIAGMSDEERKDFARQFQSQDVMLAKKSTYVLGQQPITKKSAYEIAFEGFGSLMVGREKYYNLKDQVKVTLNEGATLESFHHFLSIFGLQDALKKSNDEDMERLKLGVLFRTFFPTQAHYIEKKGSFFTLPMDELKQKLIDEAPKMKKIMEQQVVEKRELFPGYVKYGVPVDKKAYSLGARALTTAVTSVSSSSTERMDAKALDQVASIVKNGLLSQEMREKNGIKASGLNDEGHYIEGGAQSIYTQLITTQDLTTQRKMNTLGYRSPVRFFISPEALNQGSYQYFFALAGERNTKKYVIRSTISEFIKRNLSWFKKHEIMIPDRILPEYIKAMSVPTQEIKQQIIAHLRKCNLIHDEKINGIPVDEYIRTEHHITPDLVKHCSRPSSGAAG